jgi:hypothetical protein
MLKPTVIFGIDMETDVGSFTPFYEGVKAGTPKLLELFEEKGITATFYFTGEAAKENPDTVKRVIRQGHEAGAHSLYHETVGDALFPLPNDKPLLSGELFGRLETMTEWIESIAGVRPVSFRAPRLWGSTELLNCLEKQGYLTDASYPMYYYRKRLEPYFPSREDWTAQGESTVLEIPNFCDMQMKSSDPPLERDRDQWPLFRTAGADCIVQKCKDFIEFVNGKAIPPVLCFYFHPWEFVTMQESFYFGEATVTPDAFIIKNCGDAALSELGKLIDGLKALNCEFTQAKRLYEKYRGTRGGSAL